MSNPATATTIPDELVRSLLNAGAGLAEVTQVKTAQDILVVPNGYTAMATEKIIEAYLPFPRRLKQAAVFEDLASFIAYVQDFKLSSTVITYERGDGQDQPKVTAIIDFHSVDATRGLEPAWKEHTAKYAPHYTEEWMRFVGQDGVHMNQQAFLNFLEENSEVILEPKGAELLDIAESLEGKNNITCNQLLRLDNGRTRLVYSEDVELKGAGPGRKDGETVFPNMMTVGIIPFENGPGYKFRARLRYRLENRKLLFWFDIVDLHIVVKQAVDSIIATVKEKTGLVPFFGTL